MTGDTSKLLKQTTTEPPSRKYITLPKCTARFSRQTRFSQQLGAGEGRVCKRREGVLCLEEYEKKRQKKKAEVSTGNKSSNAEHFLPEVSSSVEPILESGFCLVALVAGKPGQHDASPAPKLQFVQVSCKRTLPHSLTWESYSTGVVVNPFPLLDGLVQFGKISTLLEFCFVCFALALCSVKETQTNPFRKTAFDYWKFNWIQIYMSKFKALSYSIFHNVTQSSDWNIILSVTWNL